VCEFTDEHQLDAVTYSFGQQSERTDKMLRILPFLNGGGRQHKTLDDGVLCLECGDLLGFKNHFMKQV
jgi:hypothetical protein